jgi:hypothetical protein
MTQPKPQKKRVLGTSPFSNETVDTLLSPSPHNTPSPSPLPLIDDAARFNTAIETGFREPRVSLYSPRAAALLEYLAQTLPKFSKSEVGAQLLDRALQSAYPDLWNAVNAKTAVDPVRRRKRKTKERGGGERRESVF